MSKRVTIHQVNYLPWIGLFNKVSQVDCFVLLDTVDYTKNSVINRNQIKVSNGTTYLTIPIAHEYYRRPLNEVRLPDEAAWATKHWKAIELNYRKAAYFPDHREFFQRLYGELPPTLVQLNERIIRYLLQAFGVDVEIVRASELELEPGLKKTTLLLALLRRVRASVYLSGAHGRDYLETDQFHDIGLEFHQYRHPVYRQLYGDFVEGMSAIDLLFNEGPQAADIVKGNGRAM